MSSLRADKAALARVMTRPGAFLWGAVKAFRANQGLLLSGAVAYYTLLSIVPLFALLIVGLSHLVDEALLLSVTRANLALLLPGEAGAIADQVALFVAHRDVIGGGSLLVMLFFSSLAFSVLENAMSVIFFHRVQRKPRPFLTSALIPYLYIGLMGAGLLLITLISGALQAAGGDVPFLHLSLHLEGLVAFGLYALGVLGLVLLLTSFYVVMPVGRISWRHAFIGGVTATVLWEIVRHVLVWYYATLSMVNVIYGPIASAVVALLSLEIAGMILLFGAQVIAEFERVVAGGALGAEARPGLRT